MKNKNIEVMIQYKGDYYNYIQGFKLRELQKITIDKEEVFVDAHRNKRCECGVNKCWARRKKDNKIIEVHETANGYSLHSDMCLKESNGNNNDSRKNA